MNQVQLFCISLTFDLLMFTTIISLLQIIAMFLYKSLIVYYYSISLEIAMNYPLTEFTTTSLPDDFAQQVLQLQMQMEFQESSTLQVVQQLNQLYRIAVQFYINQQDQRKIQHFQRKLQQLFTHPRTLQAIQNKEDKVRSQKVKVGKEYSTNLKKQMNKFNQQSQGIVKSMLVGSEIKLQRTCRLVNQNIENQEEKLRRRLQSRSKSRNVGEKIR